jgi:hypothetical protein
MRQWVGLNIALMLLSGAAFAALPANDDYVNRTVLEGESITVTAQFLNATIELSVGDPPRPGFEPVAFHYFGFERNQSGSLWWEWTAPRSGSVVLTAAPASGDPLPEHGSAAFNLMALSRSDHPQLGLLHPPPLDYPDPRTWVERSWISLPYQGLAYSVVKGQRYVVYGIGNAANPAPVSFQLQMAGGPVILQNPSDVEMTAGDSGLLKVVALGVPLPGALANEHPLRYAWLHEGEPVAGASNSAFPLLSVSARDAGEYRVVVTDAEGSVTSAVARVDVVTAEQPPILALLQAAAAYARAGGGTAWVLSGAPGRTYVIESSADLIHWRWQPVEPISALSEEALVTRSTSFRDERPSHVRIRREPFAFTAAGEFRRHLFLRARRATPFDSRRWTAMEAAQYAKEDYGRDVRHLRWVFDGSTLFDISRRMPAVLYPDLFDCMGVGDCRGVTLLLTINSPPQWPCLSVDPALIDPNAYFLAIPGGIWDPER